MGSKEERILVKVGNFSDFQPVTVDQLRVF